MAATLAVGLIALLATWAPLIAAIKASLVGQVRELGGRPSADDLTADPAPLAAELLRAMVEVAGEAAGHVVAEAAGQGATVAPSHPAPSSLQDRADRAAGAVTAHLQETAAAGAQSAPPASSADEIAAAASDALDALDDRGQHAEAGAAMHGAMNTARLDTLRHGPVGAVYSSELNDSNTCSPCHEIDGRWLGNTDDMATVELSYPAGAYGGYIGCLGRERCRGTVVGVWREGAGDENDVPAVSPGGEVPLRGHIATGEASAVVLGGGLSARTELVTFNDGFQAVRKTVTDDTVRDPRETADAEELASIFAARLGVPAPEVVRSSRDTVYMAYVDNARTGGEIFGAGVLTKDEMVSSGLADLVASVPGRRLGLFDFAIGNTDRNGGNYLLDDSGRLVAIDHGWAWQGADPLSLSLVTQANDFMRGMLSLPEGGGVSGSMDFSRADVEHLRQVLEGMRPEFARLRRLSFYADAHDRLDILERHATGDGSVF
jgi:hypothetical protein